MSPYLPDVVLLISVVLVLDSDSVLEPEGAASTALFPDSVSEPEGAELEGAEPEGAEPEGAELEGAASTGLFSATGIAANLSSNIRRYSLIILMFFCESALVCVPSANPLVLSAE